MAKRRRESDSDDETTPTEDAAVFVDTSLGTSFAMHLSKSDTASDFKKKIVFEHRHCYPGMEIHVHSLKVERGSRRYLLSDRMPVWSAFHRVKESWFLYVDASSTPSNQNPSELDLVEPMKMMDVRNVDNNCGGLPSDINRTKTLRMALPDGADGKNEVLDIIPCIEFRNTPEKATDIQNCKEKSPVKKKRKMRHTRDVKHEPCLKESDASYLASSKDVVTPDTLVCGISTVDAVKEGIKAEVSVVQDDESVLEGRVAFEGTSVLGIEKKCNLGSNVDHQNPTCSVERKNETVLESTIIPENLTVSQKEYDVESMDANGTIGKVNSTSTKRKKRRKKVQETAVNIQDATMVEQTLKGKNPETHKSKEKLEEKHLSLNLDHEVEMPSSHKAGLTQKKEHTIMIPCKQKKIEKKSANTNLQKSGTGQTYNDISDGPSGFLCPSTHHIPVETGKVESILSPRAVDVQLKLLDGSTLDVAHEVEEVPAVDGNEADFVMLTQTKQILGAVPSGKREANGELQNSLCNVDITVVEKENQVTEFLQVEKNTENTLTTGKSAKKKKRNKTITADFVAHVVEKVPAADGNEADFVMSTPTKQTLEAVPSGKSVMNKEIQNSPCNGHVDIPVVEKENQIVKLLQVGKDNENTLTTGKSAKKKRRKKTITASDVKEDLSVKNQNVIGVSTVENSIKFGYSGMEGIHAVSSQVISRKSKEKLQEEHDVVNIQDTTEMEQTLKDKNLETHKTEEKEEKTHLSLNLDHEVEMPSSYMDGLTQKKEHKIKVPSKKKKKKIEMESANTNLRKSGTEQAYNDISGGSSGLLCMSMHHIPVETGKEDIILSPQGVDAQLILLNGSNLDVVHVVEEVPAVHGNEAEFVMATQTEQTLEAVPSGKKETNKEILNSLGNGHVDIPVVEKENQIAEFLQMEKDTENEVNTGKSSKRKRKNRKITTTDVQEDLSVKNQSVVGLSTVGNSIKFGNSGMEGIHVASSEVISRKSKERLQEENDVVKVLNGSTLDVAHVVEEVHAADGNETDFVMSTPTKQTLEAVPSGKSVMNKEIQNSPGNGHVDIPAVEKENQIAEFLQVGKDNENTVNTGKSVKKKRRNKTITADFVAHVVEEVPAADVNEADFVMSTPTKQTLEAVPSGKSVMNKEIQNSPCNGHVDIPAVEKENQIVELLQVGNDNENTVNTGKDTKKKIKNKTVTASDVQKDLSVTNQNIVIGSSTEENLIKFESSGMEGIHVASSQVISPKSKEKLEEELDDVVYTDDLARTTENEGEGVNFKQYFVPDNYQDISGSNGKVKKSNQSDVEMKTLKKLKNNGLSSVSMSTEVQSQSKLSRDGERRNKSRVGEDSGKKKRDSAENSDRDEVIPNSSMRSTGGLKKRPQGSVTSEIPETVLKKHKEVLAVSSLPMKKNISPKKSILERTERFPEKRGNKIPHLDVNVTNRMELKTPKKKSLLTKVGSLFEDDSGESSADDNGTAHSSDSTQSPSDSSSTSDHSVGESITSLDSTRNGVRDAQVRSTGGKDTPMLEELSSKNVTLKMLLQSSNRFKKIKQIASQNEEYQNDTQPIEFVPDSQP